MNKSNGRISFKYNLENMNNKMEKVSKLALEALLRVSDGKTHYFEEDAQELGVTTNEYRQAFIELEKVGILEIKSITYDEETFKKNRVEG